MIKRPKHLIIPDAHAIPELDNDRFEALGNLIVEERPDVVICIGDGADMASLSSFDKGTRGYEGRRYQRDVDSFIDAQDRMFAPIKADNRKRHQSYNPRLVYTLGNHEYRIEKLINAEPGLYGKVGVQDLKLEEHGWEVYPFLQPVVIDGIAYAHYFASGVAGRPISGENIGKTLCVKLHQSAVQGHSHIYDHSERAIISGHKIFGLSCGCFTHPKYVADWNRAFVQMWWRGIVILEDLDGEAYYDKITTITLRKMMRDYI